MVQVKGKYNVKGKVLLLPVVGDSNAEVTFCKYCTEYTSILKQTKLFKKECCQNCAVEFTIYLLR